MRNKKDQLLEDIEIEDETKFKPEPLAYQMKDNINCFAHIWTINRFNRLTLFVKFYSFLNYSRWISMVALPYTFFYGENRVWLILGYIGISALCLACVFLQNKNRTEESQRWLIISEASTIVWLIPALMLAIDYESGQDFLGRFFTVFFLWIFYLGFITNHVAEIYLAYKALRVVPPQDSTC